jgi:hypothetical protein
MNERTPPTHTHTPHHTTHLAGTVPRCLVGFLIPVVIQTRVLIQHGMPARGQGCLRLQVQQGVGHCECCMWCVATHRVHAKDNQRPTTSWSTTHTEDIDKMWDLARRWVGLCACARTGVLRAGRRRTGGEKNHFHALELTALLLPRLHYLEPTTFVAAGPRVNGTSPVNSTGPTYLSTISSIAEVMSWDGTAPPHGHLSSWSRHCSGLAVAVA